MDQFLSYFLFDPLEIAGLSILFVLFLMQLFFYVFFYNKPVRSREKAKNDNTKITKMPSVSVVIIATDESENLAECLPVILNQDYTDYEVIVVNNGSTEETDTLLKRLKLEYSHLYDTFLPQHSENEDARKKLAITIGIKASRKNILLFTEANAIPSGRQWISSMMQEMTEDKDIVLGYCLVDKTQHFLNRLIRFDNLLFSLQYLSSALRKRPFTGAYQNVAYRKELFFDNKGFSSFLNYKNCEGIFLNYIMSTQNTALALSDNSFVSTKRDCLFQWENFRTYQYQIKKHFRNFRFFSGLFSLETLSRYLFYVLIVLIFTYSIRLEEWGCLGITGILFVLRIFISGYIINKAAQRFRAGVFRFSYIIIELLQPLYCLYFRLKPQNQK